jgi:hypothetical protein
MRPTNEKLNNMLTCPLFFMKLRSWNHFTDVYVFHSLSFWPIVAEYH